MAQEDRLTILIARACRELELPDEHAGGFADSVARHVNEMGKNHIKYDACAVSDAIIAYNSMVLGQPSGQGLFFELESYAATTAHYFLAKEAVLKDKKLMALFSREKDKAH